MLHVKLLLSVAVPLLRVTVPKVELQLNVVLPEHVVLNPVAVTPLMDIKPKFDVMLPVKVPVPLTLKVGGKPEPARILLPTLRVPPVKFPDINPEFIKPLTVKVCPVVGLAVILTEAEPLVGNTETNPVDAVVLTVQLSDDVVNVPPEGTENNMVLPLNVPDTVIAP